MGIKPPLPEWGNMISDGRSYMTQSYHMLLWPIVAIIITVLALNLLGEGLRDFSNPYDTLATEMEDVK
jgi:peptide/nickel transport system permease protein